MNEQRSRMLDFWVGIPLCWLFTLGRRLADLVRTPSTSPPRKILFIKLSEMGAIALAMPAFEAAARRVGRQNVYCLMLAANREMHELAGFFSSHHQLLVRDENLRVFLADAWRLLRRCRREGIDCVIDLEGFSRISAILSWLTGARLRVGLHRYTIEGVYRGDLFTHRVLPNYYNHASVQFLTLIEALDHQSGSDVLVKQHFELPDYRLPRFQPTPDERQAVLGLLGKRLAWQPGAPLILFNPNLVDLLPLRRWPRSSYVDLGRQFLAAHPGTVIALIGLSRERPDSIALAQEISTERCHSLAGETSIRGLATLFSLADLLVSSDSGPPHMAAFVELPTISIFGPETPRLYAPLNPRNVSLWSGLACSPCLIPFNHRRSPCRNNICTQVITVDQVLRTALGICPALAMREEPAANRA